MKELTVNLTIVGRHNKDIQNNFDLVNSVLVNYSYGITSADMLSKVDKAYSEYLGMSDINQLSKNDNQRYTTVVISIHSEITHLVLNKISVPKVTSIDYVSGGLNTAKFTYKV